DSAMVSLNRFWMSSMLPMFAICNSSRIFSRRAFSSGVRFLLAMCNTSCLLLLFYTSQQVYTNYGIVSNALISHTTFTPPERSLMLRLFSFPVEYPARGSSGDPAPQRHRCSYSESSPADWCHRDRKTT